MRMQLRSMLLLFGVSFFIFAGFKNADPRGVKIVQSKAHSGHVTIDLIVTGSSGTTFTGTFTADGALETSGTFEMETNFSSDHNHAHCSQTFTSPRGTFTAISDCEFIHWTGTWYIIGSTGRYSHLQGNGKLLMTSGGLVEAWSGRVRRDRGDDDEGDNNQEH